MIRVSRLAMGLWLAGTGCGQVERGVVEVRDGLGTESSLLPEDSLHGPYAVGARLLFSVTHAVPGYDHQRWTVISTDTSVATVVPRPSRETLQFDATVTGPGSCTFRVFRTGSPDRAIREIPVRALAADDVRLLPNGSVLATADLASVAPASGEVGVGKGGRTAFMVRLFHGGEELFGTGGTTVDGAGVAGPHLEVRSSSEQGLVRDWLHVDAGGETGEFTRGLRDPDQVVRSLTLRVVEASEVASVELAHRDESALEDGTPAVAVAVGRTAAGQAVYGLPFRWRLGDEDLFGTGDLIHYEVRQDSRRTLAAEIAGIAGTTEVRGDHASVGSSGDRGCSQAAGATPALVLLGLAWKRRRRAVSGGA